MIPSTKRDLQTFKELQSFSVYVNLFSQTEVNGITKSIFKIIVEDNISHHKYIGYSGDKSRNNIDIFVNYVLSNLEMRGGIDKNYKLITGKNSLAYNSSGKEIIRHEKKHKTITDNYSHKQILASLYRELIFNDGYAEVEGYSETKNPILPPIFVDRFIGDFDKITRITDYWRNREFSEEENKALKEALAETGLEAEKYQEKFEFDNALKFYSRLNAAAKELADSEKLSAGFLLKQVKIYFHLEDYERCRELIESCRIRFEKQKLKEQLGELYYYFGMIANYENKISKADTSFATSSKYLINSKNPDIIIIYHRSRLKRYIIHKDFKNALTLVNKAIRYAFKINCSKELSFLYGIKAEIYFSEKKYKLSEDSLKLQLDYSRISQDLISEIKCLTQFFRLFSFTGNSEEKTVADNLKRIKLLSKKTDKSSYYYDSLINMGVYYYRCNLLKKAEIYFNRASRIYTSESIDTSSHIVNMIYLSKIRILNQNYLSATRLLLKMLKMCEKSNVRIYPAYVYNSLGRIYFEKSNFKKSINYLNKVFLYYSQENLNDILLKANTFKLIGLNYCNLNIKSKALKNLNLSLDLLDIVKRDQISDIEEIINEIQAQKKKIDK